MILFFVVLFGHWRKTVNEINTALSLIPTFAGDDGENVNNWIAKVELLFISNPKLKDHPVLLDKLLTSKLTGNAALVAKYKAEGMPMLTSKKQFC